MSIKFFDDIFNEIEEKGFPKLPNDGATGDEFEEWLGDSRKMHNCITPTSRFNVRINEMIDKIEWISVDVNKISNLKDRNPKITIEYTHVYDLKYEPIILNKSSTNDKNSFCEECIEG
ncbi:hypothetical protein OSC52_12020 [Clostridium pasteurianum]|uniref:hypothetical protein n=1 Tax=Clostridium pasteurianum TaxID=1501 RepID=UPI002260EAC5|nr:hypothetical protein [Clostridium pasteurianum]UZW12582.1 hypothetical protein OSC52_12020 [Clostridium pasteurianum]